MTPRYTVGSLSGWNSIGRTHHKPRPTWYVHDSLWCYRIVGEFHDRREGSFWNRYTSIPAELQARSKAHKLNKQHRKWLRQRGLL